MVTQITDHADRAQARLPEQFKGKERLVALIRALAGETQAIEDAAYPMFGLLDIDTMIGDQLDGIGDILTEPRAGQSDADYCVALKAKAMRITASGTPEQIIERFIALASPTGVVDFINDFPAGYCIGAVPLAHDDTQSGAPIENKLLYSDDFTNAAWLGAGILRSVNRLEDANATAGMSVYRDQAITDDSSVYTFSVRIKKDTDTTRFPELQMQLNGSFGNFVYSAAQVNTQTGACVIRTSNGTSTVHVADEGLWWRVELRLTNNAMGNTNGNVHIYPAQSSSWLTVLSTVGAIDVKEAQLEKSPSASTYIETGATAALGIALTTGGIGTDDEFVGGYACNVTRDETYEIIRHIDDSVTLDGVLTSWLDTDVLFLYSAITHHDILSAIEAASGVGVYVGLVDLFALEDDDLILLEDGDTMYVTYESSGR